MYVTYDEYEELLEAYFKKYKIPTNMSIETIDCTRCHDYRDMIVDMLGDPRIFAGINPADFAELCFKRRLFKIGSGTAYILLSTYSTLLHHMSEGALEDYVPFISYLFPTMFTSYNDVINGFSPEYLEDQIIYVAHLSGFDLSIYFKNYYQDRTKFPLIMYSVPLGDLDSQVLRDTLTHKYSSITPKFHFNML